MTQIDMTPAADALATVVAGVRDDQLDLPTPCPDLSVAAILDHVDGFAWAFDCAARKETVDTAPHADAAKLVSDWRTTIPERLTTMAEAWRRPEAWQGRTQVGGIEQTAEETGYVGVDELIVHGWDLARATGQEYSIDDDLVAAARSWVAQFASDEGIPGLFGPQVHVRESATPLQELLALTGRDPAWSAAAS